MEKMANPIARATGYDSTRTKTTQRLGALASEAQANTWETFTTCYVHKDGSGHVEVKRRGEVLHRYEFGPENASSTPSKGE